MEHSRSPVRIICDIQVDKRQEPVRSKMMWVTGQNYQIMMDSVPEDCLHLNSVNHDKMLQNATFHPIPHCFVKCSFTGFQNTKG